MRTYNLFPRLCRSIVSSIFAWTVSVASLSLSALFQPWLSKDPIARTNLLDASRQWRYPFQQIGTGKFYSMDNAVFPGVYCNWDLTNAGENATQAFVVYPQ
jgi:hypothetical protein